MEGVDREKNPEHLGDGLDSVTTVNRGNVSLLSGITYTRMALVPVVMAFILAKAFVPAAALFVFAASTDWLDGFLARRWDTATTLGSFLDTTADKLLVSGALIALVAVERASPWVATIIVGRELLILGLRGAVAMMDGFAFKPSIWGKLKANAQFAAILLAILRYPGRLGPLLLDEWAMLGAALITVISAIEYVVRFSSVFAPRGGDH
jgi:CDP-diacylglycerol--glycerol-3-phosphate 3-phosphatidyltransferase